MTSGILDYVLFITTLLLQIIEKAIDATVNVEKVHTEDLGGNATTTEVVDSVLANIKKMTSR